MRSSWTLGLVWVVLWIGYCHALTQPGEPETNSGRTLRIRLYDLAAVPSPTLDRATIETSRILAAAGLDAVWEKSPANNEEAHAVDFTAHRQEVDRRGYIVLRIIRGAPETLQPGALGFALPFANTGSHVTIFCDRIERLSHSVLATVPKILGHAMAHEIGHVLLVSSGHTSVGIMKARWSQTDFHHAVARFLEFTPAESAVLRDSAQQRVVSQNK